MEFQYQVGFIVVVNTSRNIPGMSGFMWFDLFDRLSSTDLTPQCTREEHFIYTLCVSIYLEPPLPVLQAQWGNPFRLLRTKKHIRRDTGKRSKNKSYSGPKNMDILIPMRVYGPYITYAAETQKRIYGTIQHTQKCTAVIDYRRRKPCGLNLKGPGDRHCMTQENTTKESPS